MREGGRRREWLRHCSAALLGLAAVGSWAQSGAAARGPLLVVGDSLSAEYGIARGSGWVALLEQRLRDEKPALAVINASISGDTTSGGRARLPALLAQHRPRLVVIELGGNDALRGMPLAHTRDNLLAMVRTCKASGARVLLVGMKLPPNYGQRYGDAFFDTFAQVAKAERVALVPFLLAGFAERADAESWFQGDRIHPLARAHPLMLDTVWPMLRPLL